MKNYFKQLALFNRCYLEGSFKNFSDGHHTFEELYKHRTLLSAIVFNTFESFAWKSKKHHPEDDEMFDGMFIVGIETSDGQATYHYPLAYWDIFDVKEIPHAPKYDGYTSDEAIRRIFTSFNKMYPVITEMINKIDEQK